MSIDENRSPKASGLERYSRQIVFPEIGPEGQKKLLAGTVVVVGCGGLGNFSSNSLVRSGVGRVRIIDRDIVELNNLQRQILFEEEDAARGAPKAEAAAEKLRRANSSIQVEAFVCDVNHRNVERLIDGADVVIDATDNLEARTLLNDACVKMSIPWIYGAALGSTGMTMNIIPKTGPCFRCVFPILPPPGSIHTCETAGIINSVPAIVASLQVVETLKILLGDEAKLCRHLVCFDVWTGSFNRVDPGPRNPSCKCCGERKFEALEGKGVENSLKIY